MQGFKGRVATVLFVAVLIFGLAAVLVTTTDTRGSGKYVRRGGPIPDINLRSTPEGPGFNPFR